TEYGWAWYGQLVGAYFNNHPAIQPAILVVEDPNHPATATLGATWPRTDEWYNFQTNPRSAVHVLLSIDESTYSGGEMGVAHPMAWCHAMGAGRAFYTALGHTDESYGEPLFRDHLLGAILTAAGAIDADCTPTAPPCPAGTLCDGSPVDGAPG